MRTHRRTCLTIAGLTVLVILMRAGPVYANPLGADPTHLAGWIVVVIASLLLEVFVTTGFLLFAGMAVVPMFFALVLGNIVSYAGIALPLYAVAKNVWLVEAVVVTAEAGFIKLLSVFGPFQGDNFNGLKWRVAFLSALAGNACSYYVGTLMASS